MLALAALLGGCAAVGPGAAVPGDTLENVRQRLGAPSAEYPSASGRRLEYGAGAFGKQAWMLDFDERDRLVRSQNVRDRMVFDRIRPGITSAELLQELGRPSGTWRVRYHDQTVWTYRFDGPFCEVFHVGVTPDGRVEDTSYGPDPLCEPLDIR